MRSIESTSTKMGCVPWKSTLSGVASFSSQPCWTRSLQRFRVSSAAASHSPGAHSHGKDWNEMRGCRSTSVSALAETLPRWRQAVLLRPAPLQWERKESKNLSIEGSVDAAIRAVRPNLNAACRIAKGGEGGQCQQFGHRNCNVAHRLGYQLPGLCPLNGEVDLPSRQVKDTGNGPKVSRNTKIRTPRKRQLINLRPNTN